MNRMGKISGLFVAALVIGASLGRPALAANPAILYVAYNYPTVSMEPQVRAGTRFGRLSSRRVRLQCPDVESDETV